MMTCLLGPGATMNRQDMMYKYDAFARGHRVAGLDGFVQLHGVLFLLIQLALLFVLVAAGRYVWKKGTKLH